MFAFMNDNTGNDPALNHQSLRPLRIWIPALLLALMIFARFVPGLVDDGPSMIWAVAAFGPFLLGLIVLLWWLALSRASWKERGLGFAGIIVAFVLVALLLHPSIVGLLPVITIPMGIGGFALAMIAGGQWLSAKRTMVGVLCCFLAASVSALFRNEGVWGNFGFDLHWRWQPSAEELFLSQQESASSNADDPLQAATELELSPVFWPGFRGPKRDGVQRGETFSDDWTSTPPQELWRIKVGPGWASFSAAGNYLFTQEQRGDDEAVVCYQANTGREIWESRVPSRFFDALGGLGPRSTPVIDEGKIFSLSAEGWLRRLDANAGTTDWKIDIREVASVAAPMWGFSSSPLVVGEVVVVHGGGSGDKGVLAFAKNDGALKWSIAAGPMSYSSLQPISVAGRDAIALLTDQGAQFIDPEAGEELLEHRWQHSGYRALQAQPIGDDQFLIPTGMGTGTRLVQVLEQDSELVTEEVWTSRALKPDFNDLVVHKGFIYGFDDSIFTCLDLQDGSRKWKKGRYGKGQVLLLADSDLILVLGEKGDVVLLRANPEQHEELATLPALEGRTWNHPIVVNDLLFVRNAAEAVCYRLPTQYASDSEKSIAE